MNVKQPRTRRFMAHEPGFTIIDAMDRLFRQWFDGESWDGWRAILRAAFCLPMTEDEIAIFRQVAGGREPPRSRVKELWIIAGRRAGKDSIASLIAAYAALFFKAGLDKLRPGEKAVVQCLACDRDQAKIVLGYIRSHFDLVPPLAQMVTRRTANGIELQNDVSIEVGTNSYKAVRGRAFLVSVLDEVAYYSTEEHAARSDVESYNAIKPGLSTLPGSMLIGISSPYRKSGLLYSKFKKHFGQDDDDVLVIQAPTAVLNPTIDPAIIAKAYEDDPQVARAEWGAEFRDDISGFVDADVVAACVSPGVRELPPMRGVRYFGFVDPSGGSSDSMTAAVAHREVDRVIVDCVRERRPPFSPTDVCLEISATLKSYGINSVQSDKYAGSWVVESFAACGIRCEQSAKPKSDLYVDLLPLLNSRRIELLDIPRLVSQLCSLERRTARGGRDSIDHAPGAHDDLANAVAGAAALALANLGVHVTPELLQRVAAMPARRKHTAWGPQRRAALASFLIQREQQTYPRPVLPAEKFKHEEGESR
jgi:hypothetical protein